MSSSRLDGVAGRIIDGLSRSRRLHPKMVVTSLLVLSLAHMIMIGRVGWYLEDWLGASSAFWAFGLLIVGVLPYSLPAKRTWSWRAARWSVALGIIAGLYGVSPQREATLSYSTLLLLSLLSVVVLALIQQSPALCRAEPIKTEEPVLTDWPEENGADQPEPIVTEWPRLGGVAAEPVAVEEDDIAHDSLSLQRFLEEHGSRPRHV